MWLPPP
ncbi:hypothetical protein YPPY92_2629, partial [Yersinia pestis PY-92]